MKVMVLCLVTAASIGVTLTCLSSENPVAPLAVDPNAVFTKQIGDLLYTSLHLARSNEALIAEKSRLISQIEDLSGKVNYHKVCMDRLKKRLKGSTCEHTNINNLSIRVPRHVELESQIRELKKRCAELSFSYVRTSAEVISINQNNKILRQDNRRLKKKLVRARKKTNKKRKRNRRRRKG